VAVTSAYGIRTAQMYRFVMLDLGVFTSFQVEAKVTAFVAYFYFRCELRQCQIINEHVK
jgi:hypothetical protein